MTNPDQTTPPLRSSLKTLARTLLAPALVLVATSTQALDVKITKDIDRVEFRANGQTHVIERIQDQNHKLSGGFAKTSRKCPPFCIQPLHVAPGVNTVGEVELLKFLVDKVSKGSGVLVDARTPSWHKRGTIPGAVNIPFTTFADPDPADPDLQKTLASLGVRYSGGDVSAERLLASIGLWDPKNIDSWDFSRAKELMLFCNGIWCGQSPRAIKGLIKLGYPKNKLHYYRGGMQVWQVLGFTTVKP